MAEPIEFTPRKYDPREALYHRLQQAPIEHVEALLDSYEILQLLRDKGILELTKGALGSGESVLTVLTKTIETDEAISLFRNLTILVKILGGLNPEVLEKVERALSAEARQAESRRPPGLLRLLGALTRPGTRRFIGAMAGAMDAVGQCFYKALEPGLRGEKRKMVTRRRVSLVANHPRDP